MCANCVTGTEVVVAHAATCTAFVRAGLVRGHDWLRGRDRMERRLAAYRANAEFIAGLGHDPIAVLGPPPGAPAAAPVACGGHATCAA